MGRTLANAIFLFLPMISSAISLLDSVPYKQTQCRLGKKKADLLLRFEKKMDSATNDFSGAPLVFLKSKTSILLESTSKSKDGDFNFIKPKSKSSCKDTVAFPIGKESLAIFYASDNRPFQDNYQVTIWNAKTDKIIDQKDLGIVSGLNPVQEGFSFSTQIPRSDADQMEMKSTNGHTMTATDKDLNALKTAKLVHKKLFIEFDPHLSYEKSQWKKFFKDKIDYLNATGWDSQQKIFSNIVVYEASSKGKVPETCIGLTSKRGGTLVEPKWRCIDKVL